MELGEIISDALTYPFQNIKALVIYIILGIILGISIIGTLVGIMAGMDANNVLTVLGSGIIGVIIALIVYFVISGYELDIIKLGITRSAGAPSIDFVRQFINGVKLFVVSIVYFIVPIIVSAILAVIFQHWLSTIITTILFIIFGLAAFMAQCRLAKTEDLGYALAIGDAIGDISRVGIVKLLLYIIIVFIIAFVLLLIVSLIAQWNSFVGGVLLGILGVYLVFFQARAMGLLYSNV